jgi:hypothetical protein
MTPAMATLVLTSAIVRTSRTKTNARIGQPPSPSQERPPELTRSKRPSPQTPSVRPGMLAPLANPFLPRHGGRYSAGSGTARPLKNRSAQPQVANSPPACPRCCLRGQNQRAAIRQGVLSGPTRGPLLHPGSRQRDRAGQDPPGASYADPLCEKTRCLHEGPRTT